MDDDGRKTCYIRRDKQRTRVDNASPTEDEFLTPYKQIGLVKEEEKKNRPY